MSDLRIQNVQREDLPKVETNKPVSQPKVDNTLANALAGEKEVLIGEQLEITTQKPVQADNMQTKPAEPAKNPDDPPKGVFKAPALHVEPPTKVELPAKVEPPADSEPITDEEDKYDENGNLIQQKNYKNVYEFKYDKQGNTTQIINRFQNGSVRQFSDFKYDEAGNRVQRIDRKYDGSVEYFTDYEYDEKGNLTQEIMRYSDGSVRYFTDYEYNEKGEKILVINRNELGYIYQFEEYGTKVDRAVIYDGHMHNDDYVLNYITEYYEDKKGNRIVSIMRDADGNVLEIEGDNFKSSKLAFDINLGCKSVGKLVYGEVGTSALFKHTFINNQSLPVGNITLEPSIGLGAGKEDAIFRTGLNAGAEYYTKYNPKSAISLNLSREDFGTITRKGEPAKHISLTSANLSYARRFNIGRSKFRATLGVEGGKMREKVKGNPAESKYYVTPSSTLEWGLKGTCFGAKIDANLKHPSIEINIRPSSY